MARVRESKRLVCTECENEITGCYDCGEFFELNDEIQCIADGLKHRCSDCME